ncbi:TPM domain-containing protein [Salinibacterium soli]|uniref:TPM domain-containing protein n=1 Tax=Antiquaquibacter soli TaxID=3064523 RepID=A0ABT9BNW7_9MICO|nr:TPM domain-containing protein [Protaetiibacter sp. WY-16]MDO7881486.1 TPM domain-containing protein [Protaetiibacter sp. WY-16]
MRSRLSAAAALLAGSIFALSAPLAASAEDPVDLNGAYVLDTVGAVSGDESRVMDALDSLYERAGIQLFVVYVDSFTGATDAVDWADTTAIDNGLGANDLLLAVAVEDRQYALSVDSAFPLSDAQLDDAESAIESELRDDAWADAAIAGAQSLEASATGVVGPGPDTDPQPTDPATSTREFPWLPVLGGAVVIGGGVFIYSRIRRRNSAGETTAAPDRMTQKELDTRAGSLLVQLDDSLKTSEQELGFAVAQFGDDATKDFTAVLAGAKAKVAEAFALKQKLDDAQPETDAEKRELTTRIIQLCEAADAELDSQADAFDDLRELEKNAPQALEATVAAGAATRARVDAVRSSIAALSSTYAAAVVGPVAHNVDQASKLLEFADSAVAAARKAISSGAASEAAVAVRSAQSSVGQANQLFDAVDALSRELGDATAKLDAVIADTTQDIADARALPQDASSATLGPAIADAERALAAAMDARSDPAAAIVKLSEANSALETVFTATRDAQHRVAQARTKLDAAISSARAQIQSAAEFISTRRGGVGEPARTRVAEADRRLQQAIALAASDPVAALTEAEQAGRLGATAFDLAQNDVSRYSRQQQYGGPAWSDGSDGADLGGLLGGFLDGVFSGGGGGWSSGGGSRSGSSWSSSRSGGSSRSSRSSRSGSFGGSSRSSSRGSGGRRSRGGRF